MVRNCKNFRHIPSCVATNSRPLVHPCSNGLKAQADIVVRRVTVVAYPAITSSIELSTHSSMRWCRAETLTPPTYIPGRLRIASSPSRTWIDSDVYSLAAVMVVPRKGWCVRGGRRSGCIGLVGCRVAGRFPGVPESLKTT